MTADFSGKTAPICITVHTGQPYRVLIGKGLLSQAGMQIASLAGSCRAAIVSDDRVYPLWGARLEESLKNSGITPCAFIFPHGETSKNLQIYQEILEFLSRMQLTRADVLLPLGGGVTGDLGGFAASTYLRGIPFIQLPASLLADVDSSVGGKTAVNLGSEKNRVGSFYQPRLVLTDTEMLETLPEDEYRNGCAEIIKCAMLSGEKLFEQLRRVPVRENCEEIIAACVELKRRYVEQDEQDRGIRALLNLGHTFGHAVEQLSVCRIPHGKAVAMGLATVTRAAAKLGHCRWEVYEALISLLTAYGLPAEIEFSPEEVTRACLSDKKRSGDRIRLIVPRAIGRCESLLLSEDEFQVWVKAGISG